MSMMPLRIALTDREQVALRKLSKMSGVPIARLVADAVRAQLLQSKENAASVEGERRISRRRTPHND